MLSPEEISAASATSKSMIAEQFFEKYGNAKAESSLDDFERLDSMWNEILEKERELLVKAVEGAVDQDRPLDISDKALQGCKLRFRNLPSDWHKHRSMLIRFLRKLTQLPSFAKFFAGIQDHDVYGFELEDEDTYVVEFSSSKVAAVFAKFDGLAVGAKCL